MKKRRFFPHCFIILFSIFFMLPSAYVQNCYVQLDDASGFEISSLQLSSIENKACEIKDIIDSSGFLNQFKVYSYGFYLDLEFYNGYSYPTAFLDLNSHVSTLSPYYLLLARQNDSKGICTNYWVDIKLPEAAPFDCLDEEARKSLSEKLQIFANEYNTGPYFISNTEIQVLDKLKWYLHQIIICECNLIKNSCGFCPPADVLLGELVEQGFAYKRVENIKELSGSGTSSSGIVDSLKSSFAIDFTPDGDLPVAYEEYSDLAGVQLDVASEIQDYKTVLESAGITGKVYILREEDICNSDVWNQMETESNDAGGLYDFIECHVLVKEPTDSTKGKLYSRYRLTRETSANKSPTLIYNALKFLGNAAIDVGVQMITNFIFDDEVHNFQQAWDKTNLYGAAWSGISAFIPWKKVVKKKNGKVMKYAVDGFAFAVSEMLNAKESYTYLDFGRDWIQGAGFSFLSELVIAKVEHFYPLIAKSLKKLWDIIPENGVGKTVQEVIELVCFSFSGFVEELKDAYQALFRFPYLRDIEEILIVKNLPKGLRPEDPNVYLNESYILTHLQKFDQGGSYIVPTEYLDEYGRVLIGRPDGQFLSPKSEIDELLAKANGDISVIEQALAIPQGLWHGKQLSRIDVPNTFAHNRRIPNGKEEGANDKWLPGGVLPTGYSEAVIDQIVFGNYVETLITN